MNFYTDLVSLELPVKEVLADEKYFCNFPHDWHIIAADITNSTEAIRVGRHTEVNLVAAGSLIAALNVSKAYNIEIPFFWGGDGGIVIVPGELVEKVLFSMNAHRLNSLRIFSLELRTGTVPVEDVINAGHDIRVAKIAVGSGFNKSIVIGDGLKYAEQKIKQDYYRSEEQKQKELDEFDDSTLNMEGLECRWDTVKPPFKGSEVVCLLIEATDPKNQLQVYNNIIRKLEDVYGPIEKRHPLSLKALHLKNSLEKFNNEMFAKYSKWKLFYFLKLVFAGFFGKLYFRYNLNVNNLRADDYLEQLITFSDTLTIDGRISTIVSGTVNNRIEFLEYLTKEEQSGVLLYGHHVSAESMMTCYVQNLHNKHIHFVDGINGGYTEASKELKPKFRK